MPASDEVNREEPPIAVALSGGGNRAALFSLGVLLYLVDTGLNRRVELISSVSGGSITNGFVAQECDFRQVGKEEFDRVAANLAGRIVRRGLFHGSWLVLAYLTLVIGSVCVLLAMYNYGWPTPVPSWIALLTGALIAGIVLLRGVIVSFEFARRFFAPSGKKTRLCELSRTVEHVFCATGLNSNAPFYFSTAGGGYVYSPAVGIARLKKTRMQRTTLSTVVRASAAFPGGIPPKRFRLGDTKYVFQHLVGQEEWELETGPYRAVGRHHPRLLFLADGGVWNNLGTQAILEDKSRRAADQSWQWRPFEEMQRDARVPTGSRQHWLIVANASAPVRFARLWRLHLPLLGEIAALMRSINILTVNTVAPRVAALRAMPACVVVAITDVYDRALAEIKDPWQLGKAVMARLVAEHPEDKQLGGPYGSFSLDILEESHIDSLAWACSTVPTTLGRIRRQPAIWLLIHGYQNAQAELYARFGCPPSYPRPDVDRFERLIPPRPWENAGVDRPTSSRSFRKRLHATHGDRLDFIGYNFRPLWRRLQRQWQGTREEIIIRMLTIMAAILIPLGFVAVVYSIK